MQNTNEPGNQERAGLRIPAPAIGLRPDSSASTPSKVPPTGVPKGSDKPVRKRGRPRDERARQLLLESARGLAREAKSYKHFNMEAIARNAGVSKSTIYRWWNSKSDLIREALRVEKYKVPNTATLLGDLEALVQQEADSMNSIASRPVIAGAIAEIVERFEASSETGAMPIGRCGKEKRQVLQEVFAQAKTRGEWPGPLDVESAFEALYGPVYFRCVIQAAPVEASICNRFARGVLMAAQPLGV